MSSEVEISDLRLKFRSVAHQYHVFFHYFGGVTPLVSRQVGFLAGFLSKCALFWKTSPPINQIWGWVAPPPPYKSNTVYRGGGATQPQL